MNSTIFYSWQSDLPSPTNRGFIKTALEQAVKAIKLDASIEASPRVDQDTAGVPGSPDIPNTILQKIEHSSVFVGDVSITNKATWSLLNNLIDRPDLADVQGDFARL